MLPDTVLLDRTDGASPLQPRCIGSSPNKSTYQNQKAMRVAGSNSYQRQIDIGPALIANE